jgi:hypothetical protein
LDGENRPALSWTEARERLIQNIERQHYLPYEDSAVSVRLGITKLVLPAYIPYVGPEYFQHRPRVLCYAINQNLSKHTRWTDAWVTEWGHDLKAATDRLNYAFSQGRALPIRPYAEGFIPLAAALLLRVRKRDTNELPQLVDRVLAVTNFVKFSTWGDASSSSIPESWWRECGNRYVECEIRTLQPDVILGFGKRTAVELSRVLGRIRMNGQTPELFGCRFPGRIPSARARPLSPEERAVWEIDILPLAERLQRPGADSYHRWRMLGFPGYFLDLVRLFAHSQHCRNV